MASVLLSVVGENPLPLLVTEAHTRIAGEQRPVVLLPSTAQASQNAASRLAMLLKEREATVSIARPIDQVSDPKAVRRAVASAIGADVRHVDLDVTGGKKSTVAYAADAVHEWAGIGDDRTYALWYLDSDTETVVPLGTLDVPSESKPIPVRGKTTLSLEKVLGLHGARITKRGEATEVPSLEEATSVEDYTRWAAHHLGAQHVAQIGQSGFHIEPVTTALATHGHQLVGLLALPMSDTRKTGFRAKTSLKLKLLEAVREVKRLGGAEARLLAFTDFPLPDLLRLELATLLDVGPRLDVFGAAELQNLERELQRWLGGKRYPNTLVAGGFDWTNAGDDTEWDRDLLGDAWGGTLAAPPSDAPDHLVLVVGRNPLPLLLTARQVGAPDATTIHLIHTERANTVDGHYVFGTEHYAKALRHVLKTPSHAAEAFESVKTHSVTDPLSPHAIEKAVSKVWKSVRAQQHVWIDHTGGKKPLSLLVRRHGRKRGATVSYLDAEQGSVLRVEGGAPIALSETLRLGESIAVHGGRVKYRPATHPMWPETTRLLVDRLVTNNGNGATYCFGKNLCDIADHKGEDYRELEDEIGELVSAETRWRSNAGLDGLYDAFAEARGLPHEDVGPREVGNWFKADWIESAVHQALQGLSVRSRGQAITIEHVVQSLEVKNRLKLVDVTGRHEVTVLDGQGFRHKPLHTLRNTLELDQEVRDEGYEVDVVAAAGPFLLLVSCTLHKSVYVARRKLLEAVERATQLGGRQAGVLLFTNAEGGGGLDALAERESGIAEGRVQVLRRVALDRDDPFVSLREHLGDWVEAVVSQAPRRRKR